MDLDQGGTFRTKTRQYLGPSIGWVETAAPTSAVSITAPGTYNIDYSTSLVQVNCAGSVTVLLPSAANPPVGPGAIPGPFAAPVVTIVDVGGHGATFPITIQAQGGQTVIGLASITIGTNFGGWILTRNPATLNWSSS